MQKKFKQIGAGQFKAHCLKLIDEVNQSRISLVITKHGKPLVKLVPVSEGSCSLFGCLQDSAVIQGDIVVGTGEEWDADQS